MKFFRMMSAQLLLCFCLQSQAADLSVVQRWMDSNKNVRTVKIDFTQTRTLRSIKVPIRQQGTLWMDYSGDQFRWQIGRPVQTIVTRKDKGIVIARPIGKRYEIRQSGSENGAAQGMSVFAGGFPRTIEDFNRKYRVLSTELKDNTYRIVTQPLGASAKGVQRFVFVIESSRHRLLGIEIELKDGSSVQTVFDRVELNQPLSPDLFALDLSSYRETKF